jgi:SAM-dependent methyltransferase
MKLNIGCGTDIRPGWVNIDSQPGPGVDLTLDLEEGHLPFEDDSVSEAYCSHVLEHLWEWEKIVLEVFRVLEPGGRFVLKVPYGFKPCAYHVRTFVPWTLDWFIEAPSYVENTSLEPGARFICEKRYIGRIFPGFYHVRKYLWRNAPRSFRFGRKHEIVWILRKPAPEHRWSLWNGDIWVCQVCGLEETPDTRGTWCRGKLLDGGR